ncbi:MAG: hypothetical protein R2865_11685 [Deinococcales bacterium]
MLKAWCPYCRVYGLNWESGGRELKQNLGFGNIPNITVEHLTQDRSLGIWMEGGTLNLRATPSLA